MVMNTATIPSRTNIFSGMMGFAVNLRDGSPAIIYAWNDVPTIGSKTIKYIGASESED